MRISNSNAHVAPIANQKPSIRQINGVNNIEGNQEKLSTQEKKTLNNTLNKAPNTADKALIYEYGAATNTRVDTDRVRQRNAEYMISGSDSIRPKSNSNPSYIRGNLVTENQNNVVFNAINSYTRNQELGQSEQISKVMGMGVDLYA